MLIIAVAIAAVCAVGGTLFLGLSFWTALLIYSLSGTVALLFLGWRKYRCVETHDKRASHG